MRPGAQTEVGRLRSVLLRDPRHAYGSQERVDRSWSAFGYKVRPDLRRASEEFDAFRELLEGLGVEVHLAQGGEDAGLDSLYPRDAAVACARGMVLCRMGKDARRAEPALHEAAYRTLGIQVCGRIEGEGRLEGGDVAWIDERTVAVGRGYRTNDEGIRQLRALLVPSAQRVLVVPLPHWRGPGDVFHLMSVFSPLDVRLALVYSPLLPVPFRQALLDRGFELVEVPDEEFESMGCNALAVEPRRCVVLAGNPETRRRLERAGVEVHPYRGEEISVKGAGGPTCLTRPLVRDPPP